MSDKHEAAACRHAAKAPITDAALRSAAGEARERAAKAGMRWTPQRERALELLLRAGGPVKAYDLVATFQPGGQTAPPTVYRALDALVELGLAHRIASRNAYVACHRHDGEAHAASFLFCDCCDAVEEFEAPVGEVMAAIKARGGFQLRAMTLEAHGRCSRCQD
ncbi:transcriptional repressor [Phenylobacterium sp. J426]|uniref:Fur family transcriptional regulator n=1 Tax=Phenylobacterium sp. J426 TaxID=2898439 RepID=UPI002151E184|nr:Fur family transcriptional regulator [Phenylobacterium sp. J426]MCR5876252.1 transcriptional repressor [Phenylobacterium sp. J426]